MNIRPVNTCYAKHNSCVKTKGLRQAKIFFGESLEAEIRMDAVNGTKKVIKISPLLFGDEFCECARNKSDSGVVESPIVRKLHSSIALDL